MRDRLRRVPPCAVAGSLPKDVGRSNTRPCERVTACCRGLPRAAAVPLEICAKILQDSTVRASLRTAYLCISLTTCRQLLTGKRSARSAVHGGARAPARNTTTLSRIPWVPARGVEREELREGLHHVRVQVRLLE